MSKDWTRRAIIAMAQRYRDDLQQMGSRSPLTPEGCWGHGYEDGLKSVYKHLATELMVLSKQATFDFSKLLQQAAKGKESRPGVLARMAHKTSGGWNGYGVGFPDGAKRAWEDAAREISAISGHKDPQLHFHVGRYDWQEHRPLEADSVEWFYDRWKQRGTQQ